AARQPRSLEEDRGASGGRGIVSGGARVRDDRKRRVARELVREEGRRRIGQARTKEEILRLHDAEGDARLEDETVEEIGRETERVLADSDRAHEAVAEEILDGAGTLHERCERVEVDAHGASREALKIDRRAFRIEHDGDVIPAVRLDDGDGNPSRAIDE